MARVRVTIHARPGFAGLGINGQYYASGTVVELDETELVDEWQVYSDMLTIERVEADEGQAEPVSTQEPSAKPRRERRPGKRVTGNGDTVRRK